MATTGFDTSLSTMGDTTGTTGLMTEHTTDGGMPMGNPHTANYYYQVSSWLFIVVIPVITVSGLVGNVLSIIVVRRSSLSSSSVSVYITALALTDSLTLLFNFANNWTEVAFGVNTLRVSSIGCSFARYCYDVSSTSSSWCIVAMAVERFIVVWFPFRAKTLCTRQNAIITVFVIPVLVALIYMFHMGIWYMDETGSCSITSPIMARLAPLISGTLFSYLPIITLTFTTTAICIQLTCVRRKQRKEMTSRTGSESGGDDATRKITIMVVVICVLFLVLTSPVSMFYIVWFTLPVLVRNRNQSLGLVRTVIQLLAISNHALNFFLYTLASEAFRKERRVMCCRGRAENSRTSTNTIIKLSTVA